MVLTQEEQILRLEIAHFVDWHLLYQSVSTAIDDCHLLFHRHRRILGLLEDFHVAHTLVEHSLRSCVKVAAELGESLQLTILSLVKLQGTGNLLH